MKLLWEKDARNEILARIDALSVERRPGWGKLSAPKMLAHVSDQIRMALGEVSSRPPSGLLSIPPFNYLSIYVIPWPKGTKGPQEAFTTDTTTWESDRKELLTLIERLCAKKQERTWPAHPMFGKMSGRDWAALSYKHLSHHLRQFGV